MADKTLGQAAYEAYWQARNAPHARAWTVLEAWHRAAWEAAAAAAAEACGGSDD